MTQRRRYNFLKNVKANSRLVADPSGGEAGGQPVGRGVRAGAAAERLHAASVRPIGGRGGAELALSAARGGGRGQLIEDAGHPSTAQPRTLTTGTKNTTQEHEGSITDMYAHVVSSSSSSSSLVDVANKITSDKHNITASVSVHTCSHSMPTRPHHDAVHHLPTDQIKPTHFSTS